MPYAVARDNTRLYYEEAGHGSAVIFLHEFAADYASWEPQMRYFSRQHRCIAYSARGYTPSQVPAAESFTYQHFRDDAGRAGPSRHRARAFLSACRWAPIPACRSVSIHRRACCP
jgi:pimeloyl-ACP methyl ester carboxylesterase